MSSIPSFAIVKFLRVPLLSAVLLPPVHGFSAPAWAQERQGCFMIDRSGALRDLSNLCPAATTTDRLGTGDIQVTLRWATADDLDLAVIDPSGDRVAFFNPFVSSGGQLDVDANSGCEVRSSTPVENVFWPFSQAPSGNYTIEVNLFTGCQSTDPIPFSVTLLVQGTTQTLTGSVDAQQPIARFLFSVPPQ